MCRSVCCVHLSPALGSFSSWHGLTHHRDGLPETLTLNRRIINLYASLDSPSCRRIHNWQHVVGFVFPANSYTAETRRKPPGFQKALILGTGRVMQAKERKNQSEMRERRMERQRASKTAYKTCAACGAQV